MRYSGWDKSYVKRTEHFEPWYENPIDLPGRWYLQAIRELFKENRLARDTFVGTSAREIVRKLVPGWHVGLFMGSRTLCDAWPDIGAWVRRHEPRSR